MSEKSRHWPPWGSFSGYCFHLPSSSHWHLETCPPTSHLALAGRKRTTAFHLLGLFVIIRARVWPRIRQGIGAEELDLEAIPETEEMLAWSRGGWPVLLGADQQGKRVG